MNVNTMQPISIATKRLILKTMHVEDVTQDYADWLNDPEISRFLGCAGIPQTMESCRAYVSSYEGREDAALVGMFLKDNGLHIGNMTLSAINWYTKVAKIGFSIGRKECMGQGYATEALSALMNFCFSALKLHKLEAGVSVKNFDSIKLLIRCGFLVEGRIRDSELRDGQYQDGYLMGITEDEYRAECL